MRLSLVALGIRFVYYSRKKLTFKKVPSLRKYLNKGRWRIMPEYKLSPAEYFFFEINLKKNKRQKCQKFLKFLKRFFLIWKKKKKINQIKFQNSKFKSYEQSSNQHLIICKVVFWLISTIIKQRLPVRS